MMAGGETLPAIGDDRLQVQAEPAGARIAVQTDIAARATVVHVNGGIDARSRAAGEATAAAATRQHATAPVFGGSTSDAKLCARLGGAWRWVVIAGTTLQ